MCSNEEMYRTVMQAGVHACISTQGDTDKTNILVHMHISMHVDTHVYMNACTNIGESQK